MDVKWKFADILGADSDDCVRRDGKHSSIHIC
jgi:hypothetical protein